MIMNVMFDEATGEIAGWGDGPADDFRLPGHSVIEIEKRDLDHTKHKVDLVSLGIVEKTRDDLQSRLRVEVENVIRLELENTDKYVDPPSDRPIKGPFLLDWRPYRQEVRDLSKLPDSELMVREWPLRPDGTDAIPYLRDRTR